MNDNQNIETSYTTSRVDQDCRCCRSGSDDTTTNMLKVVWGNDVNISIQLSKKVGDQYESYDLSDGEDYELYIVDKYGDRVEFPIFIASNRIKTILDSQELESNVPYSIEVIWKEGPYDKRVFGRDMFMYVNSSIDATPSDTSITPQTDYEYNIVMEGDVCYISIGQIPEVDLSNYVTQGELTTSLDALWQDCNDIFVDHEELADAISDLDLSDYVSSSELDTTLTNASYVTESSLNTTLSDYVTSNDLTTTLSDYVTQSSLDAMSYVSSSELDTTLANASYVTESSLNTTLSGYVSNSELDTTLANASYVTYTDLQDAISGVTIDETNLVHKTGNEEISGFKSFNNTASFGARNEYIPDVLSPIHQLRIYNKSSMSSSEQFVTGNIIAPQTTSGSHNADVIDFRRVTTTSGVFRTSSMGKITPNGIYEGSTLLEGKYLQIANLPTIPTATSELTNDSGFITNSDLTTIESDITSLDGRVTTLEQSGSGVSQEDWDNTNEAIAQELTDNRLAHLDINNQFSYYYTKTESDSRYATQSWANNKFVTQSDDVNRQEAIAAAFAYLQTSIDNSGSDIDLSSYVTIDEMNNYSEVVSTALTYHKLDIVNINNHFDDYYTKTQSDSRYATSNAVAQQYVNNSSLDNLSYVVATSLNDLNDRMPSYTSDLTNDSGFVTSSSVTTIWQGSQADYDAITTKDTNTLYVIV